MKKVLKQLLLELNWATFVIGRRLKVRALRLRRLFVRPQLPKNRHGKVLVHLGCGDINSPEYINVDACPAPHVHYVCDVTDLSIFQDNYADLVYACHLLEHIHRNHLRKTLWEWRRILKTGGVLRLSVPGFDALLDIYRGCNNDIDSITAPLMGGQESARNIHYSVFNLKSLSALLTEVGLRSIQEWDPKQVDYHDFDDYSSYTIIVDRKRYPVSLNIEAVK